jgi:hypothetical protein
VIVDGQCQAGPQGDERLVVQLSEGRHTIEVRRNGYRAYITDVEVRRGQTTAVDVTLTKQ